MIEIASGTENINGHISGADNGSPINCVNKLPVIIIIHLKYFNTK